MPRPRLAALARLAAATLVVLGTSGNTGCQAPGSTKATADGRVVDRAAVGGANAIVGARTPEIISAGDDKLNVAFSDIEIVLTSPRTSHDFDEITYVISLDDDPTYNLQFASAADRDDFMIRVSFKRLFRGTYSVKAYGDKRGEAFASASFRVTEEGF